MIDLLWLVRVFSLLDREIYPHEDCDLRIGSNRNPPRKKGDLVGGIAK